MNAVNELLNVTNALDSTILRSRSLALEGRFVEAGEELVLAGLLAGEAKRLDGNVTAEMQSRINHSTGRSK